MSSRPTGMARQRHPDRRARFRAHLSVPLFRNAYLLITSSALVSALGLPFWLVATRQYTTETVGLAATAISAMILVSGVSQLGMSSVLPRYLPGAQARTRHLIVKIYVGTAAVAIFAASLAAATSQTWSPPMRFLHDNAAWFALFVGATLVWTILTLQDSVLVGMRRASWVLGENVIFAVAKLALVGVLANSYPHAGIFLAWVLPAAILIVPMNVAVFLRFVPLHEREHLAMEHPWPGGEMRRLIIGNYAGALVGLIGTFTVPILVTSQLGAEEAAYFFIPWALTLALAVVAANMATSMVVEAAFAASRLREYSRSVLRGTARIVVPVALGVFVFAPDLLDLFGHEYSREGTWLLRLLAIGTIPNAVTTLGLSIARIRHDGRLVATVQATVAAVLIGLTVLLLPYIGIEGAGIAWLTSQIVGALLTSPTLRVLWTVPGEESSTC
jgi:O-antigen/teichoic acid export membrane protein